MSSPNQIDHGDSSNRHPTEEPLEDRSNVNSDLGSAHNSDASDETDADDEVDSEDLEFNLPDLQQTGRSDDGDAGSINSIPSPIRRSRRFGGESPIRAWTPSHALSRSSLALESRNDPSIFSEPTGPRHDVAEAVRTFRTRWRTGQSQHEEFANSARETLIPSIGSIHQSSHPTRLLSGDAQLGRRLSMFTRRHSIGGRGRTASTHSVENVASVYSRQPVFRSSEDLNAGRESPSQGKSDPPDGEENALPCAVYFSSLHSGGASESRMRNLAEECALPGDLPPAVYTDVTATRGFAIFSTCRQANEFLALIFRRSISQSQYQQDLKASRCLTHTWMPIVVAGPIHYSGRSQPDTVSWLQELLRVFSTNREHVDVIPMDQDQWVDQHHLEYSNDMLHSSWMLQVARSQYIDHLGSVMGGSIANDFSVTRSPLVSIVTPEFSQRSIFVNETDPDRLENPIIAGSGSLRHRFDDVAKQCALREPTSPIMLYHQARNLELRDTIARTALARGTVRLRSSIGDQNISAAPLQFHDSIGQYICLGPNKFSAESIANGDGLCYSSVPIKFNPRNKQLSFEILVQRVPDTRSGCLSIGITTSNPSNLNSPSEISWMLCGSDFISCGKILKSGYAKDKDGLHGISAGDTLKLIITESGILSVEWNGADFGLFVLGVPTECEVYAVVDLYAAGTAVQLKSAMEAPNNASETTTVVTRHESETIGANFKVYTAIASFASMVTSSPHLLQDSLQQSIDPILNLLLSATPLEFGASHDCVKHGNEQSFFVSQIDHLRSEVLSRFGGSDFKERLCIAELKVSFAVATGHFCDILDAVDVLLHLECHASNSGQDQRPEILRVPYTFRTLPHQFIGLAKQTMQHLPPIAHHSPTMPIKHILVILLGWVYSRCHREQIFISSDGADGGVQIPVKFCRYGRTMRVGPTFDSIEQVRDHWSSEHSRLSTQESSQSRESTTISAQTDKCLSRNAPYFHLKLLNTTGISIGVSTMSHRSTDLVGSTSSSSAYHLEPEYPGASRIVTVGCGQIYNATGKWTGLIAFTINDHVEKVVKMAINGEPLFPTISLQKECTVRLVHQSRWPRRFEQQLPIVMNSHDPKKKKGISATISFDELTKIWTYYILQYENKPSKSNPSAQRVTTVHARLLNLTLLMTISCCIHDHMGQIINSFICSEIFEHLQALVNQGRDIPRKPADTAFDVEQKIKDIISSTVYVDNQLKTENISPHKRVWFHKENNMDEVQIARLLMIRYINAFIKDQSRRFVRLLELVQIFAEGICIRESELTILEALGHSLSQQFCNSPSLEDKNMTDVLEIFETCLKASAKYLSDSTDTVLIKSTTKQSSDRHHSLIMKIASSCQEFVIVCINYKIEMKDLQSAEILLEKYLNIIKSAFNPVMERFLKMNDKGLSSAVSKYLTGSLLHRIIPDCIEWVNALPRAFRANVFVGNLLHDVGLTLAHITTDKDFENLISISNDDEICLREWSIESAHNVELQTSSPHNVTFSCPGALRFVIHFDAKTELDTHLANERFDFYDNAGRVVHQVRGRNILESKEFTVNVADSLRITFLSVSKKQLWGYKFIVRAQGKTSPQVGWLPDLAVLVARTVGYSVSECIFGEYQSLDMTQALPLPVDNESMLDTSEWAPLFQEGISDANLTLNKHDAGLIFKSHVNCEVSSLVTLVNNYQDVSNAFWKARAGKINMPPFGGGEIDQLVVAMFATVVHHSGMAGIFSEYGASRNLDSAVRLSERLRPWLIHARQDLVAEGRHDGQCSFSIQFLEKFALLLSLNPMAKVSQSRAVDRRFLDHIAGYISKFIKDSALPKDCFSVFTKILKLRTTRARRRLQSLKNIRSLTSSFGPISVPSVVALRGLSPFRNHGQDPQSPHFFLGCHGCLGTVANELRREYCDYVGTLAEAFLTDKEMWGLQFESCWYPFGIILRLMTLEWAEADLKYLCKSNLFVSMFDISFRSSQASAHMDRKLRQHKYGHFSNDTAGLRAQIRTVEFQSWHSFSALLDNLASKIATNDGGSAQQLLQQVLIIVSKKTLDILLYPSFFVRVVSLLSELSQKSQTAVAVTIATMSQCLISSRTGGKLSSQLLQVCLTTFSRSVINIQSSFLASNKNLDVLDLLASSPVYVMSDENCQDENPSSSMEWGQVVMKAVQFLVNVGILAAEHQNCRSVAATAAAIRDICASSSINQFVTPLLRAFLRDCIFGLCHSSKNEVQPRIYFGLRVAADIPRLLSPSSRFQSMDEEDTVLTLVNFNPFTLSCTMYGSTDELVSKPAVVLQSESNGNNTDSRLGMKLTPRLTTLKDVITAVKKEIKLENDENQKLTKYPIVSELLLKVLHGHLHDSGSIAALALLGDSEIITLLYKLAVQSTGQHLDLLLPEVELLSYFVGASDIRSEYREVYSAEPRRYRNCSKKFMLRVRANPDLMADVVGLVEPNEEVLVVEHFGNWCKVKCHPSWIVGSGSKYAWAMHVATDADQARHLMLEPVESDLSSDIDDENPATYMRLSNRAGSVVPLSMSPNRPVFNAYGTDAVELPVSMPITSLRSREWRTSHSRRMSRRASLPGRLAEDVDHETNSSLTESSNAALNSTSLSVSHRNSFRSPTRTLSDSGFTHGGGSKSSASSHRSISAIAINACARCVESCHPIKAEATIGGSICIPGAASLLIEFAPQCHTLNVHDKREKKNSVASFLQDSIKEAFRDQFPTEFIPNLHNVSDSSDSSGSESSERPPGSPGSTFKGYAGAELLMGTSDQNLIHTVRGSSPWGPIVLVGDTVSYVYRTPAESWGFKFRVTVGKGKQYSMYDEGLNVEPLNFATPQRRSNMFYTEPPARSAWSFKPTLTTSIEQDSDSCLDADLDSDDSTAIVTGDNDSEIWFDEFSKLNEDGEDPHVDHVSTIEQLPLRELFAQVEAHSDAEHEVQKKRKLPSTERSTPQDHSKMLMKSILAHIDQIDHNLYSRDIGHAAAVLRSRDLLVLFLANWPSGQRIEMAHIGDSPDVLFGLFQHTSKHDPALVKSAMASLVRHASRDLLDTLLSYASTCVSKTGKVTIRKRGPSVYCEGSKTYRDQVWIRGATKLLVNFDPSTYRVCHADELTLATNWNLDDADDKVYTSFNTPKSTVVIPGDRLYIQYHSTESLAERHPWSFTVTGCGIGLSNVGLSLLSTYVRMIGTAFKIEPTKSTTMSSSNSSGKAQLFNRALNEINSNSPSTGSRRRLDSVDSKDRFDRSMNDAVGSSPRTAIMWQSEMLNLLWRTLNGLVTQLRGRALLDCIRLLTDLLGIATPEASLDLRLLKPLAHLHRRVSDAGEILESSIFVRTLGRLLFVVEDKAQEMGQLDHIVEMWASAKAKHIDFDSPSHLDGSLSAWNDIELN